jgi:hypothetical protein
MDLPMTIAKRVTPKKNLHLDKRDSSGQKVVFTPSEEFLATFVGWRKSRMDVIHKPLIFS